jgi:hypothetical protein
VPPHALGYVIKKKKNQKPREYTTPSQNYQRPCMILPLPKSKKKHQNAQICYASLRSPEFLLPRLGLIMMRMFRLFLISSFSLSPSLSAAALPLPPPLFKHARVYLYIVIEKKKARCESFLKKIGDVTTKTQYARTQGKGCKVVWWQSERS